MKAYLALLAASQSTGMPHRFRTDLTTHDAEWLAQRGEAPFAWALYPNGTHIVDPTSESKSSPAYLVDIVTREFTGVSWYWWDGLALTACTPERVKERCAEQEALRARFECAWIVDGRRNVFDTCTGAEWLRDNDGDYTAADLPGVGEEIHFGGGASPLGSIRRVS